MIKYLWRWHPKVALRYLPIVNKIKSLGLLNKPVLEIGSGSLGIAPYLGKPVVGVDINFNGAQIDLLTKVRANAVKLPFPERSFNTVIMVDVLEHLEPKMRIKAIKEAFRVANDLLVIATPCGAVAMQEDIYLSKYFNQQFGYNFPFLEEHLKYGLPKINLIEHTIKNTSRKLKRKISIEVKGNVNISLHRFLMKGWMTKNFVIDIIFRKFFLILIPLMLFMNWKPTYRKIFFIKFIK